MNAPWQSWLISNWPNWLQTINYPVAGVGDLQDLNFSLGVGQDGKWLGFINPGWYYHSNTEQYNYVQVATILVSGASGVGTVSDPISFRPSWGPVLVESPINGPYTQHNNSFQPGVPLSWSLSPDNSEYLVATLPTSSLLYGLRNLTTLPLGAVAGLEDLTNDLLYYYDFATNQVYIQPSDLTNLSPSVWADILYTYPLLRFREIVISETDASGNQIVNPSYNNIENIKIIRGYTTVSVTGAYHSSGSITHSLSGTYDNDWIVLDYWISRSFVLYNHMTMNLYCGGSSGSGALDTFTIYHENSIPDLIPNITVNVPSTGICNTFNVNPLFQYSYRSGYLFHGLPASSINDYWTPSSIQLNLDKDHVCSDFSELLKMKIIVYGDNDLPLPYYNLTVTVTGGSAVIQMPQGMTDGRGEVHYLIRPDTTGSSVIVVTALCGTLSASAVATIVSSSSLIDINKWYEGFVQVLVTNDQTSRGGFSTFVTACAADGLPRDNQVNLISKLSSEFQIGTSQTVTQNVTLSTCKVNALNLQAISQLGYVPQLNDSLVGYSNLAISKIITGAANGT